MQAFAKLTHEVDGERRIIADPPLIVPIEDLLPEGRERDEIEGEIRGLIRSYRRTLETDRRHLMEDFHYVDRVVLSTVIERGDAAPWGGFPPTYPRSVKLHRDPRRRELARSCPPSFWSDVAARRT